MMEKLSPEEFDKNYAEILENIENAAKKIGKNPSDIILLAATKTVDAETINYAINKGVNHIGENKVQEFLSKNDDIIPVHRHFIGHLQTNKVKDIIEKVEMIHSVDSYKLASEISKQAKKHDKIMDFLIEVNIGDEDSKWGFKPDSLLQNIQEISKLPNIRIRGLMAIPPICNHSSENRVFFKKMYKLFIDIKGQNIDNSSMDILSMGMSDDYSVAIEEGSNLIRLGTALFGKRVYK